MNPKTCYASTRIVVGFWIHVCLRNPCSSGVREELLCMVKFLARRAPPM